MLKVRNLDFDLSAPVEGWPFEAIYTVVERGALPDWRRLAGAIVRAPWGTVARQVEEVLAMDRPYGTAELFENLIVAAREEAKAAERSEVAKEVTSLIAHSGLSLREFARQIGTSASRLSTYTNATVVPSAALVVRMRRLVGQNPTGD